MLKLTQLEWRDTPSDLFRAAPDRNATPSYRAALTPTDSAEVFVQARVRVVGEVVVGVGWDPLPAPPAPVVPGPLAAEQYPGHPGDPAWVQRALNTLPEPFAAALAGGGLRVVVFSGVAAGSLPEYGSPAPGVVPYAFYSPALNAIYIPWDATPSEVFHEAGHAADFGLIQPDKRAEWPAIYARESWTGYSTTNHLEGLAESIRRRLQRQPNPSTRVEDYITDTLGRYGL